MRPGRGDSPTCVGSETLRPGEHASQGTNRCIASQGAVLSPALAAMHGQSRRKVAAGRTCSSMETSSAGSGEDACRAVCFLCLRVGAAGQPKNVGAAASACWQHCRSFLTDQSIGTDCGMPHGWMTAARAGLEMYSCTVEFGQSAMKNAMGPCCHSSDDAYFALQQPRIEHNPSCAGGACC